MTVDPNSDLSFGNLPEPAAQQVIGMLFVTAGLAEGALAFQLLRMMAHPNKFTPQAMALVSGMDVKVKLGLIRTYAALHANKASGILGIVDDIRSAFGKRNDFAHSVITPDSKNNGVTVRSLKFDSRGRLPEPQRHTIEQIKGYAGGLHSSVLALDKKLTELGYLKLEPFQLGTSV